MTSSRRSASVNASCRPAKTLPSVVCAATPATMPSTLALGSSEAPAAQAALKVISTTASATTVTTAATTTAVQARTDSA